MIKELVKALRSGKYKQSREALCNGNEEYCSLKVETSIEHNGSMLLSVWPTTQETA